MKYFSMLIKPASSLCNMRCTYCFYEDVSSKRSVSNHGIMSLDTMEKLIVKTLYMFDEEVMITYAFQGGEPTLAGLEYFEKFTELVNLRKKAFHHVTYCLQTNGLLIDDKWCEFFKRNKFLIGVSLDGFERNHDAVRRDQKQNGTYRRILENINKLQQAGVEFNILTVLTSFLSRHAKELFEFYREHNFRYIQLIPCLPELDGKESSFSLKPEEFFGFYDEFFKLWYGEWKKGNGISVAYFDNLIPMFRGIPPQQCGYLGFCRNQFITESDGSVYPCDFYVLDKYCLGNITRDSMEKIVLSRVQKMFIHEKRTISDRCVDCKFEGICHGQCKRMSVCYYNKDYCGLQEFMTKNEQAILEIAASL